MELDINEFLETVSMVNVTDIKYSVAAISHEALPLALYSALITYKKYTNDDK